LLAPLLATTVTWGDSTPEAHSGFDSLVAAPIPDTSTIDAPPDAEARTDTEIEGGSAAIERSSAKLRMKPMLTSMARSV
jgi:hypothetical protein